MLPLTEMSQQKSHNNLKHQLHVSMVPAEQVFVSSFQPVAGPKQDSKDPHSTVFALERQAVFTFAPSLQRMILKLLKLQSPQSPC